MDSGSLPRITVWNEFRHERKNPKVTDIYPDGIHTAIADGLRNGSLKPVVGRTFAMSEAARAHDAVMAPGALGKIVLLP